MVGKATRLDLAEVAADVLLTAPPFSAIVVEQFALDMAAGGLEQLHERIAGNRARLREAPGRVRAGRAGRWRVAGQRLEASAGRAG